MCGCANENPPIETDGSQTDVVPNKAAKQEIIVAFGQDIVTFDPHNYRGSQDLNGCGLVYETLVTYDKDFNIVPCLAEKWEWASDKELIFHLRKGVKFHNGDDFTAECVKFSIERNNAGSGASYSNFITEVEIKDDYTVVCHMDTPYGPALNGLANKIVAMMSPSWVEEVGDKIVEQGNGTGPFCLEEFSPGARQVFVKNHNYWGEEVSLDRIEFRPIPETGTRVMALKSGEVDVIENPPPQEIIPIEEDPNLYVYKSPKMRTLFLAFNLSDPNVGGDENKALREAIAYSVNTQEIADGVLEGLAIATDGNFYPEAISHGYADTSWNRKYDLDKAKRIVAENGLEGRTVEMWCTNGRYLLDSDTAQVLQNQIEQCGIKVKITVMEYGPMMTACSKWEQEMHQLAWGWNSGDASTVFNQIFSSNGAFNCSAYQNEEFDNLVKTGASFPDVKDRMGYYDQALRKIIEDEADLIPIVHYMNLYAANKKVAGLYANPIEVLELQYVSITD
jgi:peptide/nickel transport system substrate-binding protein